MRGEGTRYVVGVALSRRKRNEVRKAVRVFRLDLRAGTAEL